MIQFDSRSLNAEVAERAQKKALYFILGTTELRFFELFFHFRRFFGDVVWRSFCVLICYVRTYAFRCMWVRCIGVTCFVSRIDARGLLVVP